MSRFWQVSAMFRFTIRELLLLTLIVALAVGWFLDRGRLTRPVIQGDMSLFVDDVANQLKPGETLVVTRDASGS